MDNTERGWWIVICLVAFFVGMCLEYVADNRRLLAELCPTILALSPTAADSLAVFREHEGCFEFVQTDVDDG